MGHSLPFIEARQSAMQCLSALQLELSTCVDEGMIDLENQYYNEVLDLIEETKIAASWEELEEVIQRGKTLETDIAAWLSFHGRTTISLPWPSPL